MNNKGQMNMFIGLIMVFMILTTFVALLPGFRDQIVAGMSYSTGLNCKGASDYNTTAAGFTGGTSTTACMALGLFIPFLALAILMGLVGKLLYDRGGAAPAPQTYYG